jgi:hypothetical protein
MALLTTQFAQKRTAIEVCANICDGWRRHNNTYCFSEEDKSLEWIGFNVRIVISLFRPGGFFASAQSFPIDVGFSGTGPGITYDFKNGKLLLVVKLEVAEELNEALRVTRTDSTNKPMIRWEQPQVTRIGNLNYELQVLIVFTNIPGYRPVAWDRDKTGFLPGGLPGSSRKH